MDHDMNEPRSEIVKCALTASEFIQFAHWAERKGLSQSSAIRMLVKEAMERDCTSQHVLREVPKQA